MEVDDKCSLTLGHEAAGGVADDVDLLQVREPEGPQGEGTVFSREGSGNIRRRQFLTGRSLSRIAGR